MEKDKEQETETETETKTENNNKEKDTETETKTETENNKDQVINMLIEFETRILDKIGALIEKIYNSGEGEKNGEKQEQETEFELG